MVVIYVYTTYVVDEFVVMHFADLTCRAGVIEVCVCVLVPHV